MKFLLLGANGQVGFELHRSLAPLGSVVAATRTGTLPGGMPCLVSDLADETSLRSLVERVAPDWIVNAAAYTAVDRAEEDVEAASRINGEAPGVLGRLAAEMQAAVLHFSTDYVFPGDSATPYRETDAAAPINAYGRTKLQGEAALRDSGARHLILRTAWVYSARGQNFLRTMLRLAATRERLTVVADQHGAPTPARLLADVSAHAIRAVTLDATESRWGTYHIAAAGRTTWHAFAQEIVTLAAGAGLIERAPEIVPITSAEFPTLASRPLHSVLDVSRLEQAFALVMPDWRDGIARCIGEMAGDR